MPPTTCERCGNEYDTDRETSRSSLNSARCPQCGQENTPQPARADGGTLETAPNSEPDVITDALTAIDTDGKEIHLHVHYHN